MSEYLIYMLIPTLISASVLFLLGIKRLGLVAKLKKMAPFMMAVVVAMYIGGEIGVVLLRPWAFDCSKTIGICPFGLPIEDLLFCVLVVLNITMGTLVFSEIESASTGRIDFLKRLTRMKK